MPIWRRASLHNGPSRPRSRWRVMWPKRYGVLPMIHQRRFVLLPERTPWRWSTESGLVSGSFEPGARCRTGQVPEERYKRAVAGKAQFEGAVAEAAAGGQQFDGAHQPPLLAPLLIAHAGLALENTADGPAAGA